MSGFRCWLLLLFSLAFASTSFSDDALTRAKQYLPELQQSLAANWPTVPTIWRSVICGQVEQESGWNAKAHLHTSREDGYGLTQMTVTPRFNIFKDAVKWKALKSWNWKKDPYNVKSQLTFLALQDKANHATVRSHCVNDEEAAKCALVCYNAGMGRWLARRQNAKAMKLPMDRWTGGLEQAHGTKENAVLYGRPLWVAVNEYPTVIFRRAVKYHGVL